MEEPTTITLKKAKSIIEGGTLTVQIGDGEQLQLPHNEIEIISPSYALEDTANISFQINGESQILEISLSQEGDPLYLQQLSNQGEIPRAHRNIEVDANKSYKLTFTSIAGGIVIIGTMDTVIDG